MINAIASSQEIQSNQQVDYNHQAMLDMILKAIWMSPLNNDVKHVMILRLWGKTPFVFHPLTIKEAACFLLGKEKAEDQEVAAFTNMEAFGRSQVPLFMHESRNMQELIDAFNTDYDSNKREMFNFRMFSGGATNRKRFTA